MARGTEIADDLQRLCCAETEGEFFNYVTEAVGTITALLRQRDEYAKALEFYANPDIYKPHPHGLAFDCRDLSFIAATTLRG